MASTASAAAKVKAVVVAASGKVAARYEFNKPASAGEGKAACWMQGNLPVARITGEGEAALADGRTLKVAGCSVAWLYGMPEPATEPALDLDALDLAGLRAEAARRGVEIKKAWNA